jgi:hypothetical protein
MFTLLSLSFIIESLLPGDKVNGHCEGDLIARILKMGGRNPKYRYVATQLGFKRALRDFSRSNYRYLHISCHGADDHFLFEFGAMYFNQFALLVKDLLATRRVFISACEAVSHENHELANAVLRDTGCISLIGSAESIDFDDAAIFWSTFYYLAYKAQGEITKIKRDLLINLLKKLTTLYPVKMNYYSINKKKNILLNRFVGGVSKKL